MKKLLFPLLSITILSLNAAYAVANPPSMEQLLKLSLEELVDVEIISSTKVATKLSTAPSTITVYDYKEIKRLGARTLSDILVLVPGIQVQIKGNNRKKLWVRGVQSEFNNKMALYIDNIPVRNAFNEFPVDEELPIESIKKIEIIRGPGSALYGANAFAAVINIFTFQAGEREKNRVKFSFGEADTKLGYFSVGKNLSDVANVMLEGKWLTTDGRKPDYDRKGIANSRDAEQQLGYLRFKSSAFDNELLFSASYSNFKNTRIDKSYPTENDRTHESLRFSVAYAHQFSNWGINFNSYYTQNQRFENERKYRQLDDNSLQIKETFDFIDSTDLMGIYSDVNYQVTDSNRLVLGMDIKNERLLDSKFTDNLSNETLSFIQPKYQNLSVLDAGFFLQDSQSFFDNKTQLTAGLRFDKLELFTNQFSYRIGLTHAFTETLSAKLLYGIAYRSPSFLEFTRSPVNSALPDVETMKTVEAQISYYAKALHLSLTVYHNNYDNFIARKNRFHESSKNLDAGVFANIDNQMVTGVELESKYLVSDHWDTFLNASWSHAESIDENKALPLLADWTVTTGIEWHRPLGIGEIRFNNHIITYGQRRDWSVDIWNPGQQQRYRNRKASFNDAFITLNSALHYRMTIQDKQALELSLTAHNVLDERYYSQPLIAPRADKPAAFDTQYQGRNIRFGIVYSW